MESPGEYLKRERELRGISLASIHAATRIPMKYLVAIESDDYGKMPHPTFVKGFIKSYCRHMGVDETDAVLRYEVALREQTEKDEKPESPRRAPLRFKDSDLPVNINRRNAIIIGAAVLLIIILAVSLALRKRHKTPPPADEKKAESTVKPNEPAKDAALQPAKTAEETKAAEQSKAPAPAAQQSPVPSAQQGAKAQAEHTLYIYAIEPVWLKIKIDNGEPFDVSFNKGQGVLYKAAGGFSLVVGNAGGVSLTYDGKKFRKPGKTGEVIRLKFPADDQKAGPAFR